MPDFSSYVPTVMPLGDSITAGAGATAQASWRQGLYSAQGAGGSKFRFVGSQTNFTGGLAATNPNHEGHSGYAIRVGGTAPSLTTVANAQIPIYGPDILISAGGANDLDATVNNDSPATVANSLSILLDDVAALMIAGRANTQIVVFTVLKRLDAGDSKGVAYNALIPAVLASKSYASRIHLVDVYNAITRQVVGQGYNDIEHPTDEGYLDMAALIWASAGFQAALTAARPTF